MRCRGTSAGQFDCAANQILITWGARLQLTVQIWRIGTNAYCVKRHDVGSFTSFAGLSPEGTGMISAGVTVSFEGTIYLRIYGTFAPTVPTTGFIGDFDGQCRQDGTCPGTVPRVASLYFSRVFFRDPGSFLGVFDGGSCGTWTQTPSGDNGDIVC